VNDNLIFDGDSGQETDTMPGTEQEEMEGIPDEEDQESSGNYPVGETSNGLPVFLNISKDGKPYLSIWDKETRESTALFINDDILMAAALQRIQVREVQNQ